MMNGFSYYHNSPKEKNCKNSKIVLIDKGLKGNQELLLAFHKQLDFPDYFGYNWDALYDFLIDLSWLKEKQIKIIHFDFPNINFDDRKTYLGVLIDAKRNLDQSQSYQLSIYFPETLKPLIEEILI